MPTVIGEKGIERIVEIALDGEEKAAFDKSVATVKALCEAVRKIQAEAKP